MGDAGSSKVPRIGAQRARRVNLQQPKNHLHEHRRPLHGSCGWEGDSRERREGDSRAAAGWQQGSQPRMLLRAAWERGEVWEPGGSSRQPGEQGCGEAERCQALLRSIKQNLGIFLLADFFSSAEEGKAAS